MLAALGLGAGALLIPRNSNAAATGRRETASGTVFETFDDGLRDHRGAGVAGVMVSNGCDVVLTDDSGRWVLPARDGDVILVVKPAHWTGAAKNGAQRLWHGYQQNGALSGRIDFGLVRRTEPERFDALLIADTQPANARELGYVRSTLLSTAANVMPAFAIHHGDVMGDDLSLLPEYLTLLDETGFPWHHCPGNHDMDLDASTAAGAFQTWKRFIGPTNSAFQYAGATFIQLNNVTVDEPSAAVGSRARYRGRIGLEQLQFVRNVLKHTPCDNLVVVSMHIPLVSFDTPLSPSDTTADREALLALLSDRPHTVSFAGHSHTTEHHYLGRAHGFGRDAPHHHHVLTAASGSWWSGPADMLGLPNAISRDGTPKGFHVLSVDGSRYTTRFVPFDDGQDPFARIYVDAPHGDILVDVFDGGPLTRVTCEIEGQTQTCFDLSRSRFTDPDAVNLFAHHADLCKPWVSAAPSSHIWSASLPPAFLSAGTMIVRIVDEYGRRHKKRVDRTVSGNEKGRPFGRPMIAETEMSR